MNIYKQFELKDLYLCRDSIDNKIREIYPDYSGHVVYGLRSKSTDKWYIGSTICGIHHRFTKTFDSGHFTLYDNGIHSFINNLDDFELIILFDDPSITKKNIRKIEDQYIIKYNSYEGWENGGFNKGPSSNANFINRNHSVVSINKIKHSLSITNSRPEIKAKRSEAIRKNNEIRKLSGLPAPSGFKHSPLSTKAHSDAGKGREDYYSLIERKGFYLKSHEVSDKLLQFPDLKKGNPHKLKAYKPKWWTNPNL